MSAHATSIPAKLSLRANFSWAFAGNIVYAACQWGMLIVLAKLSSPSQVGQFALGLAITAPVMMFASLDLRLLQATDTAEQYRFGHYLALRLATTVLAILAIGGIIALARYPQEASLVILVLGLAKGVESISDVYYGLWQRHERMDLVAWSLIIKGPLSLAVLAAGIYATGSIVWGTLGLLAIWALVLLVYDLPRSTSLLRMSGEIARPGPLRGPARQPWRPRWNPKTLAQLAWLAFPLGLAALLGSLDTNIPRYFIQQHGGEALLGMFAAIAYFDRAGSLVVHALGRSASARLARFYEARERGAFRALLLRLGGMAALLGLLGIACALAFGDAIVSLVYKPEYANRPLFVGLMAAAAMGYVTTCLTYGLTAARRLRVQLLLHAVVTVALVLGCMATVPRSGLQGAMNALVWARGIQMLGVLGAIFYVCRAWAGNERKT